MVVGEDFMQWPVEKQRYVLDAWLKNKEMPLTGDAKTFWKEYNASKVIEEYTVHLSFIRKAYMRFEKEFEYLTYDDVRNHDASKQSFIEIVGYTERFTYGRTNALWSLAVSHHYRHNDHHPEYFIKPTYGSVWQKILSFFKKSIDVSYVQSNMTPRALEEAILDMIACSWARMEEADPTDLQLCTFDPKFLTRFTAHDRVKVLDFAQRFITPQRRS